MHCFLFGAQFPDIPHCFWSLASTQIDTLYLTTGWLSIKGWKLHANLERFLLFLLSFLLPVSISLVLQLVLSSINEGMLSYFCLLWSCNSKCNRIWEWYLDTSKKTHRTLTSFQFFTFWPEVANMIWNGWKGRNNLSVT